MGGRFDGAVGRRRGARALAVGGALLAILASGVGARAGEPRVSPGLLVRRWKAAIERDDAKAFASLVAEYRATADDTLRSLLVSTVCDAIDSDADRDRLRAWREQDCGPADAWLWDRSLRLDGERDPASVLAVATSSRPVAIRAAALAALAAWADPAALAALPAAVRALDEPGPSRDLLLSSWARVLASQPGRTGTPEFRAAAEALVDALDDSRLGPRARLALARSLARAFETDAVPLDVRSWRSLLARVDAPGDRGDAHTTAAPGATFFGLRATGDRVVYALDASNSMDDALDAKALATLRRLAPPDRRRVGPAPADSWKDVRTSRDAVAELTKLSLRALPSDAKFCVILFGSAARTLPSTPTLVAATPARVAAACRDLDVARKAAGLGTTNLHGVLRRALAIADEESRPADPTDPVLRSVAGPTTLFLLSDGEPSRDDWDDTFSERLGKPWFARPDAIRDDVDRLNTFVGCEIHTVALGTSAETLLSTLARRAGGLCRVIGDPSSEAAPAPAVAPAAGGPLAASIDAVLRVQAARVEREGPAARAIGSAASADTRRALRDLLARATDDADRASAALHLARLGDRAAVPALLALVDDDVDAVRASAIEGLEALAHRTFGPAEGGRPARVALRRNWAWWWARQGLPSPASPAPDVSSSSGRVVTPSDSGTR